MSDKPQILERRFFSKGTTIFEQGEESDGAYLVQTGQIRVYITNEIGKTVELGLLGVGQIVGEMALLGHSPRTASVEAATDCTLIYITRMTLDEKVKKTDPTVRAIMQMLMRRLDASNHSRLEHAGSVAEMISVVELLYRNMKAGLPPTKKATLDHTVLPKLDDFLNTVRDFQIRYDLK